MVTRRPVFLDASGWIAILNADDIDHLLVTEALHQLVNSRTPLITTDLVIAEVGNGLARTRLRTVFVEAIISFDASKQGETIRIDGDTFKAALDLYATVNDKTWGLVDCASFVVMRNHGINEALTADRHFEQAGFTCLLRTK